MKLNWKDSFKEESNNRLFEVFSEKKRINSDPQIFAGNLLFERGCDLESIEEAFSKKHSTEPIKIRRENTIKEIAIRTLFAIIAFSIFYNSGFMTFNPFTHSINHKTIAVFMGLVSFMPLFWLKRSNEKAIKKVENEIEKKNNLIKKIDTELKF